MMSKSLLLLLAFAALAHCQRMLTCSSTWTGKSTDLPTCTTLTAYPEMSKQCLLSEILGYRQQMYTIAKDDADTCLSVVIRVKDSYGGEETYVYRGPLNAFGLTDCSAYCDGVIEAKKWFQTELQTTLTPLYVSCLNNKLNNEDLTPVAHANAGASGFTCSDSNNYATDTNALPPISAPPNPSVVTVNFEPDPNSEYASIPGWYFMSIAMQAVALVVSLGIFIYTIMLYVGLKKAPEISPDDMEMK